MFPVTTSAEWKIKWILTKSCQCFREKQNPHLSGLFPTKVSTAARARDAVLKSKTLSLEEQMDIYDKLKKALEKNDIRTILMIYNKYK